MRASVPKPEPPQALPVPRPTSRRAAPAMKTAPAPSLEDYWLIRDSTGHVGWVRARTLDEDVPDPIAGLGEGQRIVGAYVLRTVFDPGANVAGNQVPEYVAVLSPWKDGLPYDFDQVRVFTWNVKKHRYETAYHDRNIAGYLPVSVTPAAAGNQQDPIFHSASQWRSGRPRSANRHGEAGRYGDRDFPHGRCRRSSRRRRAAAIADRRAARPSPPEVSPQTPPIVSDPGGGTLTGDGT